MKSLTAILLLAVCAHAQYWPVYFPWLPYAIPWQRPHPYPPRIPYWGGHGPELPAPYYPAAPLPQEPLDDSYAASLGGAPVGLYNRRQNTGPFGTTSEVTGVSLGNAKVGLYGKDRGGGGGGGDPYY